MNIKDTVIKKLYLILVGIYALIMLYSILSAFCLAWGEFVFNRGDFDRSRRNYHPVHDIAIEARERIPEGSAVDVSPAKSHIYRVAARYLLYPLRFSKNGDYFLDITNIMKNPPPNWETHRLSKGTILFSKAGKNVLPHKQLSNYPAMKIMTVFLVSVFMNVFIGLLILQVLKINAQELGVFYCSGAAYLLGFLLLTVMTWVFLLFGGMLTSQNLIILWSLMSGFLIFLVRKNSVSFKEIKIQKLRSSTAILALIMTVLLGMIFLMIAVVPISNWDEMSHWVLKSKVFFDQRILDFSYTHHNYYPLLWPLNIASQFTLMGGAYDEIAKWTAALFYLLIMSQLKGGLAQLGLKLRYQYLAIILYIFFFFSYASSNTATAENAYIAFLMGALTAVIGWLRYSRNKNYAYLLMMMCAGIVLTKFEGMVALIFIVGSLLSLVKIKYYTKKDYLAISALLGLLILPFLWICWIKAHGFASSIYHFRIGITFEKIWFILNTSFGYMVQPKMLILLILCILFFVLYPNKRKWDATDRFLLLIFLLQAIFSIAAHVGISIETIKTNFPDTFPRLLNHAALSFTLLWASRAFCHEEQIK